MSLQVPTACRAMGHLRKLRDAAKDPQGLSVKAGSQNLLAAVQRAVQCLDECRKSGIWKVHLDAAAGPFGSGRPPRSRLCRMGPASITGAGDARTAPLALMTSIIRKKLSC
jgi:hypothetical protein